VCVCVCVCVRVAALHQSPVLTFDYGPLLPRPRTQLVPVVDERSSSASQQVLTCVPSADMPAPSPSPVAGGRGPSSPLRSGTPLSRSVKGASPRRAYYAGTAASPSWVEAVLDRLLVVVQFLQANVFEEQPEVGWLCGG